MLEKVFTRTNVIVNGFLSGTAFLVWIAFLGHSVGMALASALLFFAIMFVFDWILVVFKCESCDNDGGPTTKP